MTSTNPTAPTAAHPSRLANPTRTATSAALRAITYIKAGSAALAREHLRKALAAMEQAPYTGIRHDDFRASLRELARVPSAARP